MSVCRVCVFVCPRAYLPKYMSDLRQIFVRVTYDRDSFLSNGVAICYVLPVLWMTCLPKMARTPIGDAKTAYRPNQSDSTWAAQRRILEVN